MKTALFAFAAASALTAPAFAETYLTVGIMGVGNGQPIPSRYAYCMQDGQGKTKDGGNVNPKISWSAAPDNTKSFALIVVDPDVPAVFDDANKDGKIIPDNFARKNFYHWVLVDIPPGLHEIAEGQDSKDKTDKTPGPMGFGVDGQNNYGKGGYDGPCPPWNDERLHHYRFTVYALDVPSLGLSGNFTGEQALAAMKGHILVQGETVGTYTNKAPR